MGEHIGFIGLGRMGARMCARLLDAGHTLTVYDVSTAAVDALAQRGAQPAQNAAQVASAAELVFASLPSPGIVQDAVLGKAGAIHGTKMKIFVDLSTTGPRGATVIANALSRGNVASLDAPVSGGITGAEKGTLSVMVSGPRASYDRIEPILKIFGKLFFMGEKPGLGQTMKLANNLMAASAMAITAEGIAMGLKAGLDPKLMIDVLNVSSGRSSATLDKWPKAVLPRSFDFGFANALSFKDVRLCLEEAEAMGVPMVVGSTVRQMLSITANVYGPDADVTDMARLLETWSGLDASKSQPK
jgi:3-hydroxyisobutyrate dehydrogenase-like beta-hydroxyacid dehydrogenase